VDAPGTNVHAHHAADLPVRDEQLGGHDAIEHAHAGALDLSREDALEIVPLGHGQHVGAVVVHLFDVVLAALCLLKLHAPALELLHH
jgi:hypothetical protein